MLKWIGKEQEKQNELESRIKQDVEIISTREKKAEEIQENINSMQNKVQKLKLKARVNAKFITEDYENEEDDDLKGKDYDELKEIFILLKKEHEMNARVNIKVMSELNTQLLESRKILKELDYVRNTKSHQIQKLARLVKQTKSSQACHARSKSKVEIKLEEIKLRLAHQQKYKRLRLRGRGSMLVF